MRLGKKSTSNYLKGSSSWRSHRKSGAHYLSHSQGFGRKAAGFGGYKIYDREHKQRRVYAFILVGCAALLFAASVLWYLNRSVEVTLNGQTVSVRIHFSIEQLIADQELDLDPGRLLAVDDTVLEAEGGERCSVILGREKIEVDELATTTLEGGEVLKITNGEDVYEPHQVQATAIQPSISYAGAGAVAYVKTWGEEGRSEVWTGEISGKTQDRGIVKEKVDCEIVAQNVYPSDRAHKYVALTFDEGPSARTEEMLAILAEKEVKATFFVQGKTAEVYPEAVAAIAEAGHELGSNAYNDVDLTSLSGEDLRAELTQGFSAIEQAGGGSTALLRAPYGLFSISNWAESMDIVSVAISWNLDSGDWLLPGASTVVDTVLSSVSSGDIILLTDNDTTSAQAIEALPSIIDGLKAAGYEFLSVSELLATDDDLSERISSATELTMPKDAVLPQLSAGE